jgi:hypothetical protein
MLSPELSIHPSPPPPLARPRASPGSATTDRPRCHPGRCQLSQLYQCVRAPRVRVRNVAWESQKHPLFRPIAHQAPILVPLDSGASIASIPTLIPSGCDSRSDVLRQSRRPQSLKPDQISPKTTASPPPPAHRHPDPRCPYARRRRQCRPRHPCRIHPVRLKSTQRKLLCRRCSSSLFSHTPNFSTQSHYIGWRPSRPSIKPIPPPLH